MFGKQKVKLLFLLFVIKDDKFFALCSKFFKLYLMLLSYYMFCYFINFAIGSLDSLRRNQINFMGKSLRIFLYGEFCKYNHISNIEKILKST